MVYQWKSGSHLRTNAQIAGEQCAALEAEGRLTASELVEVNRPKDAPLHGVFEWRDKVAGSLWREHQARHIINSLEVVRVEQEPVRAFFNIEVKSPNYYHLDTILQEQDKTSALLETALRELRALEKKYGQLSQLAAVWSAIDTAEAEGMDKSA